ncbi:hypothetical protein HDU84_006692 [Entophlyctis sp. JEL0112]|nr:hypothetical protein HDU84_006692 [Entophlyctis sp. JEL0112]
MRRLLLLPSVTLIPLASLLAILIATAAAAQSPTTTAGNLSLTSTSCDSNGYICIISEDSVNVNGTSRILLATQPNSTKTDANVTAEINLTFPLSGLNASNPFLVSFYTPNDPSTTRVPQNASACSYINATFITTATLSEAGESAPLHAGTVTTNGTIADAVVDFDTVEGLIEWTVNATAHGIDTRVVISVMGIGSDEDSCVWMSEGTSLIYLGIATNTTKRVTTTTSTTTTTTTTATSTSFSSTLPPPASSSLTPGAITGIAVSSTIALLGVMGAAAAMWMYSRRYRRGGVSWRKNNPNVAGPNGPEDDSIAGTHPPLAVDADSANAPNVVIDDAFLVSPPSYSRGFAADSGDGPVDAVGDKKHKTAKAQIVGSSMDAPTVDSEGAAAAGVTTTTTTTTTTTVVTVHHASLERAAAAAAAKKTPAASNCNNTMGQESDGWLPSISPPPEHRGVSVKTTTKTSTPPVTTTTTTTTVIAGPDALDIANEFKRRMHEPWYGGDSEDEESLSGGGCILRARTSSSSHRRQQQQQQSTSPSLSAGAELAMDGRKSRASGGSDALSLYRVGLGGSLKRDGSRS